MNAPNAWQIEQAMSALMSGRAALLAADPDLAAIAWDEAALSEALKPETDDVFALLHRILRASVQARAMADAADKMLDDLTARRDRYKRRAETMRGTVFAAMDALGIPKIEMPDITASIAKGRPRAIVTNELDIPEEYTLTTIRPNMEAIRVALNDGVVIPGVEMSNAIPSLHVRTK